MTAKVVDSTGLELTRFSGHLILWLQGVHHAENPTAVPT
jgi:hypothetical protein